jgi:hypothetical protein
MEVSHNGGTPRFSSSSFWDDFPWNKPSSYRGYPQPLGIRPPRQPPSCLRLPCRRGTFQRRRPNWQHKVQPTRLMQTFLEIWNKWRFLKMGVSPILDDLGPKSSKIRPFEFWNPRWRGDPPVLGNFHRNRCNGNRKGTKELFSTREHHH